MDFVCVVESGVTPLNPSSCEVESLVAIGINEGADDVDIDGDKNAVTFRVDGMQREAVL